MRVPLVFKAMISIPRNILGRWKCGFQFIQFVFVVEGDQLDALISGVAYMRSRLGGIRENYARRIDTHSQNLSDLLLWTKIAH